jgi:hypothetical protein
MRYMLFMSLLAHCAACGIDICANTDYYTSQGVCIQTGGYPVDRQQLERTIAVTHQIVRDELGWPDSALLSAEQKTGIRFVPVGISAQLDDLPNTYGYNRSYPNHSGYAITVDYEPESIYFSHVPHELLHSYTIEVTDDDGHPEDVFGPIAHDIRVTLSN